MSRKTTIKISVKKPTVSIVENPTTLEMVKKYPAIAYSAMKNFNL